MFSVKVVNMRKGPFGQALAFFDVAIGDETDGRFTGVYTVTGFALKRKRAGGYFYQAPAKPRRDREGNPAVKDGYPEYDEIFDVCLVEGPEGWKPSKAGWKGKAMILAQATEQYEAHTEEQAGRATAKPAPKAAKAPVKAPVLAEAELDEDDGDGELPF